MDSEIRVLHVQHSLEPGGMENGVVNVANVLHGRGFDIHVCCLAKSGSFAERLPEPGNVHVLGKPEGFSLRTVWRLNRLISRIRPDVIHSHNLGALIYASLATWFGRTGVILHGEHGQPDDGVDGEKRMRQRTRYYRAAKKVHTVSSGLRAWLLERGFDSEQVIAIINGVDTEKFVAGDRAAARAKLGLPNDVPVCVIVGRLLRSKNHCLLFEALEEVEDVQLLVVGAGGDAEEEIKAAAAASPAADRIRMVGFQSDPRDYFHAADLLVSPSLIEGLSNVVLEAMACGLPVLVHDALGNREVIRSGDEGIVADLSTRAKLASEMSTLLGDPHRLEAMGARARKTVEERFSLEGMAEGYGSVYRELAGRP